MERETARIEAFCDGVFAIVGRSDRVLQLLLVFALGLVLNRE